MSAFTKTHLLFSPPNRLAGSTVTKRLLPGSAQARPKRVTNLATAPAHLQLIRTAMTRIMQCGPLLAVVCTVWVLSGCSDRKQTRTETTATTADSATATLTNQVCYRQVTGRDTTLVRLVVDGAAVTGELAVLPAEKDRATGPFAGTLTNNQVMADWQRLGEGVTQVHQVNFTMAGDSLLWREGERVEKQGKWVLVNPNKGFQYVLTKADCPE